MTKSTGFLLCLLALANAYTLWRLEETAVAPAAEVPPPRQVHVAPTPSSPREGPEYPPSATDAQLVIQLEDIKTRLVALEKTVENIAGSDAATVNYVDRDARVESIARSFSGANNSTSEEDWFWNGSDNGGGEASLSFAASDGFIVKSMVCRSAWCRVEIDAAANEDESLISDLELHLRINESLGRDTVIRPGEKSGNSRVLFIQ